MRARDPASVAGARALPTGFAWPGLSPSRAGPATGAAPVFELPFGTAGAADGAADRLVGVRAPRRRTSDPRRVSPRRRASTAALSGRGALAPSGLALPWGPEGC